MIKINLLPPEHLAKIRQKEFILKAAFTGAAVFLALAGASSFYYSKSARLESLLQQKEAELKILQKDVEQVKKIEQDIAELEKYLNSIAKINQGRLLYTSFMQDLLVELPSTIWFTNLSTSLSGNTLGFNASLFSNSSYDLAYWINYLEKNSKYSEVVISGISVSESDTGKTLSCPVSAKYLYK
ncbi:MAG: hypothetical protein HY746_04580 [Elusimicrobia bacterium]|nr:hypothetical protein [Elusimicrobiota bacterium]